MNQPPLLILWFVELIKRLGSKIPGFFKGLAWFSGLLTAVTTLPDALNWLQIVHIQIPFLNAHVTEIVRYCSIGILFTSLLPTQSKPVGVNQEGQVIKSTDVQKLPFTAKSEQNIVDKTSAPSVVVTSLVKT